MNLSKQSIIKQLCNELLAWKDLRLHPNAILGTLNQQQAYRLYHNLLTTGSLFGSISQLNQQLEALRHYVLGTQSSFFEYYTPVGSVTESVPQPMFCATYYFREAISSNTLQENYDEAAQTLLIKTFLHFVESGARTGIEIAAETGNTEMVAFLLRPEFASFDLEKEYRTLLDNALVQDTLVRQAIFRACGIRLQATMSDTQMDELIGRINTIDEWAVFYESLNTTLRQKLLNSCTAEVWIKFIHQDNDVTRIAPPFISEQDFANVIDKLILVRNRVTDGGIILRLMERMSQADRLSYVFELGERVNSIFPVDSSQATLNNCLTLLGYDIKEGTIKLNYIHAADPQWSRLLRLIHAMNQEIWISSLDNKSKLQYFYVVQRIILAATPKERLEAQRIFEACVENSEYLLRDQQDEGSFFLMRWLRKLFRALSIIPLFPITMKARELLHMVTKIVAKNPVFHAVILDFNDLILPAERRGSKLRKTAIAAFLKRDYADFWKTMSVSECLALLTDVPRLRQLLQEANSYDLIRGLSPAMMDALVDISEKESADAFFSMWQILPMEILNCFGLVQKNSLLQVPARFKIILSTLSEVQLKAFLKQFEPSDYIGPQQDIIHIQTTLAAAEPAQYELLTQYFKWETPLTLAAKDLASLLQQLTSSKLVPFWSAFLKNRQFTVEEIAQIIVINSQENRLDFCDLVVEYWLSQTTLKSWSDGFFVILPYMKSHHEDSMLATLTPADFKKMIVCQKIELLVSGLSTQNTQRFLSQYQTVLTNKSELIALFKQLAPSSVKILLSKPPYDYLKLLGCKDVLAFIRQLRVLNDEQWEIIGPNLFDIAVELFGKNDLLNKSRPERFLALLMHTIPAPERVPLMTLFREANESERQFLLEYLYSDRVQLLMAHQRFHYRALTLHNVRALKLVNSLACSANSQLVSPTLTLPVLTGVAEVGFRRLIQSHRQKIQDSISQLEGLIFSEPLALIKLMVPTKGWFGGFSFDEKNQANIIQRWEQLSRLTIALSTLLQELDQFNIIMLGHSEKSAYFNSLKSVFSDWAGRLGTFISEQEKSLQSVELEITFQQTRTKSLSALKLLQDTLSGILKFVVPVSKESFELIPTTLFSSVQPTRELIIILAQMDSADQQILLANIPDAQVLKMMTEADDLEAILSLKALSHQNSSYFLARCRSFFINVSNHRMWFDRLEQLSPSALKAILVAAPQAVLASSQCQDFLSLVRQLNRLSQAQWHSIVGYILDIGRDQFGHSDRLFRLMVDNIPTAMHQHIFSLFRNCSDAESTLLIQYFESHEVNEMRKINKIQDEHLTTAALPELLCQAKICYQEHLAKIEVRKSALDNQVESLTLLMISSQTALVKLLSPEKRTWGVSSFFRSTIPVFDAQSLQKSLDAIAGELAEIRKSIIELKELFIVQTLSNNEISYCVKIHKKLSEKKQQLSIFMASEAGKNFIDASPECHYRTKSMVKERMSICLQHICREIKELIDDEVFKLNDELASTVASGRYEFSLRGVF